MLDSEREAYRLHGRLRSYGRAFERARGEVARALAAVPGEWAVSVSGGKDSVALLHVALSAGWRGCIFHFWTDEIPPENSVLAASRAAAAGLPFHSVRIAGDFDFFTSRGSAVVMAGDDDERRAMAAHERAYFAAIDAATDAAGYAGVFMGLRRQESRARSIHIAKRGTLYKAASRQSWTSLPLASWSGRDIWACLIANDLPWLDRYDMADNRERERSEPVFVYGSGEHWARGQGRSIREGDPALWARICRRWPNMRIYG